MHISNTFIRSVGVILLGLVVLSGACFAQFDEIESNEITPNFLPVVIQGPIDGLLLGAELQLGMGARLNEDLRAFTVGIGGAYGFKSQAARFRSEVSIRDIVEISYGDWPESQIYGRLGEQGIRMTGDLIALYRGVEDWYQNRFASGENQVRSAQNRGFLAEMLQGSRLRGTAFEGSLWEVEGEADRPEVQYAYLDALIYWPFSTGFTVDTIGELLLGRNIDALDEIFQAFTSTTRLSLGELAVSLKLGEITNGAELSGFNLDLGLKSYSGDFLGERFVAGALERSFVLFSDQVYQLDLRRILGTQIGWLPIYMNIESSVYFEGGVVLDDVNEVDEILFGWGASVHFPDLQMRVDIAINRNGEPNLILETGFLP